jgi:CheY-like chemotaxis protein/HPt (histidine-containing phosphotransfer) domain-containing protein
MMKGRIWVESEPGRGSTFHFTARFELQKDAPTFPEPPEPIRLQDLPVLVVDDNATNRRILQEMLTNWRMQCVAVPDGPAALSALEQAQAAGKPFALVLLDGMMPEMDGFALAERIRQRSEGSGAPPTPPTLMMLSSADRSGDAARCRALGVAAYLTKPIKQSDLLDAIMSVLGASVLEPSVAGDGVPAASPGSFDAAVEEGASDASAPGARRLRLLLAEDNEVNQRLAARVLEKRGHTVVIVNNGREALAALERERFDLVLMDVQMPEMDGFEATALLREREQAGSPHIPIIAMTAHAMKGDRERCLAAGMDAYISKPLQAHELFDTIHSLLAAPPTRATEAVAPEAAAPAVAPEDDTPVWDRETALNKVEGDVELLREIAGLFAAQAPSLLDQIQDASRRGDAHALERSAHSLKGSVATFGAQRAFELARDLEMRGRAGNLEGTGEVFVRLEHEISRLEGALETGLLRNGEGGSNGGAP